MLISSGMKLAGFGALFLVTSPILSAAADEGIVMTLATSPSSNERLRMVDGQVPDQNPGWFVELNDRAAKQCGAKIEYVFMPWARALENVKGGKVSAAFNSSYKLERAEYGAYPMKDGKADEGRASKRIIYVTYVSKVSSDSGMIDENEYKDRIIAIERNASIIPTLEKKGARIYETANYATMLKLAAQGRVDGAVGIEQTLDAVLADDSNLAASLTKIATPLKRSVGYVMFSKEFFAANETLVECFWSTSAELRNSDWFKAMRATYAE